MKPSPDDIHYSNWGMAILAKGIKKSLYSSANRGNKQLQQLRKVDQPTPSHSNEKNPLPQEKTFPPQVNNRYAALQTTTTEPIPSELH